MTRWVDRIKFRSSAMESIGEIMLNLSIAAGGMMLFMIGVLLFAS